MMERHVDEEELTHGIPTTQADLAIEYLGIDEHTEEDCRLSDIVLSAAQRERASIAAVLVDGDAAWVFDREGEAWTRFRIAAGARRRILDGTPPVMLELEPWSEDD